MFTTSMSEMGHQPSANNNASELSFEGEKPLSPQPKLPAMSEHLPSPNRERELPEYRFKLIILMVEVRLEEMGYSRREIREFASEQTKNILNTRDPDVKDLNQIALDIVFLFLYQHSDQFRGGRPPTLREHSHRSEQNDFHENAPIETEVIGKPLQQVMEPQNSLRQILCSICCVLSSRFREEACRHTFCEQCIRGYVRENISSGNFNINCPEYNCHHILSKLTIQSLIVPQEYQRFIYFKDKNDKELNPNNKFCSRPDCGEILIKRQQHLHCQKCNYNYCQICLQQAHEGFKCDVALTTTLDHTYNVFKIKKCPNCKSPIEKSEGCNHMNCKKCKHEFCWICLKTYTTFHYKYYNCFGCPGMQFEEEEEVLCERTKQLCLYISLPLIITIILACYLTAIPIYMLGSYFYKPLEWIRKGNSFPEASFVHCLFFCLAECVQDMILWVILQPRAALYTLFVAPIRVTAIFCKEICRAFE